MGGEPVMSIRVSLHEAATIMSPEGPVVVVGIKPMGYVVRSSTGEHRDISYREVELARTIGHEGVDAVVGSVRQMLESVSEDARQQAYDREEVVLTLDTGFARGHQALAREGEPFWPFDPELKVSLRQKIEAMAQQLAQEHALDRRNQRAAEEGRRPLGSRLDCPSKGAISAWHRRYFQQEPGGVFGLIDGRRLRGYSQFPSLVPEIKRVAEEVVARQDGTESTPRKNIIYRRVTEKLLAEGMTWEQIPERTLREYIAHLCKPLGRTTRAHKSNLLRLTASYQSFPAVAIGQIVAIDVTRADNFCYDPFTGRPVSVEVITAIDLAGRIIVACRVIPRSAIALEAGLILVDVLRPFSLAVEAGRVQDWRWAGLPENIDLFPAALAKAEQVTARSKRPLIGTHDIPRDPS